VTRAVDIPSHVADSLASSPVSERAAVKFYDGGLFGRDGDIYANVTLVVERDAVAAHTVRANKAMSLGQCHLANVTWPMSLAFLPISATRGRLRESYRGG
jgi:hypothetical protein